MIVSSRTVPTLVSRSSASTATERPATRAAAFGTALLPATSSSALCGHTDDDRAAAAPSDLENVADPLAPDSRFVPEQT